MFEYKTDHTTGQQLCIIIINITTTTIIIIIIIIIILFLSLLFIYLFLPARFIEVQNKTKALATG